MAWYLCYVSIVTPLYVYHQISLDCGFRNTVTVKQNALIQLARTNLIIEIPPELIIFIFKENSEFLTQNELCLFLFLFLMRDILCPPLYYCASPPSPHCPIRPLSQLSDHNPVTRDRSQAAHKGEDRGGSYCQYSPQ